MTVVYIDLLFLLNLIANYLLLLAAGRIAGAVLLRWRIGLRGRCTQCWCFCREWNGWPFGHVSWPAEC